MPHAFCGHHAYITVFRAASICCYCSLQLSPQSQSLSLHYISLQGSHLLLAQSTAQSCRRSAFALATTGSHLLQGQSTARSSGQPAFAATTGSQHVLLPQSTGTVSQFSGQPAFAAAMLLPELKVCLTLTPNHHPTSQQKQPKEAAGNQTFQRKRKESLCLLLGCVD
eukprot:scaffold133720_cov16-Tisochrysis_lutea.AAC.1